MIRRGIVKILGGKCLLAPTIAANLDAIPHRVYVEPFCGGCSVYLTKAQAKYNVLNDINGELANLIRVAAWHPDALVEQLRRHHRGREEFNRVVRQDPTTLTDIQRAARYWVICEQGFINARSAFSAAPTGRIRNPAPNWLASHMSRNGKGGSIGNWDEKVDGYVAALTRHSDRLRAALVESRTWQQIVGKWDLPSVLMYLDPPYPNCEGYGVPFGEAEHRELAAALHGLQRATFVLSLSDCPLARELYADCASIPLRTLYHTRGTGATRNRVHVTELLIFGPPGRQAVPQPRPSEPTGRKPRPTTETSPKRRSKPVQSPLKPGITAPE